MVSSVHARLMLHRLLRSRIVHISVTEKSSSPVFLSVPPKKGPVPYNAPCSRFAVALSMLSMRSCFCPCCFRLMMNRTRAKMTRAANSMMEVIQEFSYIEEKKCQHVPVPHQFLLGCA